MIEKIIDEGNKSYDKEKKKVRMEVLFHYRCGVCGWIIESTYWLCHWARQHTQFLIPFTIKLGEPSVFKSLLGYDYVHLGAKLW